MPSHRLSADQRSHIIRLWVQDGIRSERRISKLARVHWKSTRRVLVNAGLKVAAVAAAGDPPTPVPPPSVPVVASAAPDLAAIVAEVIRQLGACGAGPAIHCAKPYRHIAVAPAPTGYTTEQKGNVSIVRIAYEDTFEQRFLLSADRHWDNPHSDQDMQKRHLDDALSVGAGICDFGDAFCCMQGKYDKRADKTSLRPEHQTGDYFDALVNTASDFFLPYAKSIIRISPGNHESSVQKRQETDLTTRLVDSLNEKAGSAVHRGGYSGWVRFVFTDKDGNSDSKKLYYTHGAGGGGPVTKGVIKSNRRAVFVPDADIVCSGHVHEEWELTMCRARLTDDNDIVLDEQIHIQLPTYKDEYGDGSSGYHVENERAPRPVGAAWLTFRKEKAGGPIEVIRSRAK